MMFSIGTSTRISFTMLNQYVSCSLCEMVQGCGYRIAIQRAIPLSDYVGLLHPATWMQQAILPGYGLSNAADNP
jgi:hypothetical protein